MKKKKIDLMKKRSLYGYFFIFPLILGILLVFIPNLVETIRFTINDVRVTEHGYELSYRGFEYYEYAFQKDPKFLKTLIFDMTTLLRHVPVIIIYSLFISVILNSNFKGRTLARAIFFVPVIFATGIITIVDSTAVSFFGSTGTIDTGSSIDMSAFTDLTTLLSSFNFSPFLMDIVVSAVADIQNIVNRSGIQIIIFLAGLQEISPAMYEAAEIEGCNKWEVFWKITFPMISPQIAVNAIYTIADSCSKDGYVLDYAQELAFKTNQYALATVMNISYLVCLGIIVGVLLMLMSKLIPRQS